MTQARITIATHYVDPDANPDFAGDFPNEPAPPPVFIAPHAEVVRFDFAALSIDEALVADTTVSDTEIALDFGDVDEAAGFVVKNTSGQDLSVAVNGVLAGSPSGAIVSAATALDSAISTHFTILDAFTGATSAATIVAAIATASAAIAGAQATLDAAIAADGDAIFTLPDGGVLACIIPPNATTPVTGLSLYTTATQSGDGTVAFKVFGSVAP